MDLKRPLADVLATNQSNRHYGGAGGARFDSRSTSKGLERSYNPKSTSYFGDGSGRDNYIIYNQGGLTGVAR